MLTKAGIHALTRMSINDTALAPKPFHGTEQDAERTEQWLQYFETYAEFLDVGDSKMQLFQLLMVDQATDWLRSLPPSTIRNYKPLLDEFRKRYSLTDIDRWRKASSAWSREQSSPESESES